MTKQEQLEQAFIKRCVDSGLDVSVASKKSRWRYRTVKRILDAWVDSGTISDYNIDRGHIVTDALNTYGADCVIDIKVHKWWVSLMPDKVEIKTHYVPAPDAYPDVLARSDHDTMDHSYAGEQERYHNVRVAGNSSSEGINNYDIRQDGWRRASEDSKEWKENVRAAVAANDIATLLALGVRDRSEI